MKGLRQLLNESFDQKLKQVAELEQVAEDKKITSEKEFTDYAEEVLKNAHGDKYDADTAKETIDAILKGSDGDFGEAVGMLKSSLA